MERWKPIKGFEGVYEISDKGKVNSVARKTGTVYRKEKLRKLHYTKCGYLIKIKM